MLSPRREPRPLEKKKKKMQNNDIVENVNRTGCCLTRAVAMYKGQGRSVAYCDVGVRM